MKPIPNYVLYLKGSVLSLFFGIILFLSQTEVSIADQTQNLQFKAEYTSQTPKQHESDNIRADSITTVKDGPAKIDLLDQGSLEIPKNSVFVPKSEAESIMKEIGNNMGPEFIGLIGSTDDDSNWFIAIDYKKSGYISEDEATTLDAQKLLNEIQKNTEESNKHRTSQGIAPLKLVGWIEPPKYTPSTHQLVWSLLAKSDDNPDQTVNYRTTSLGREGYFSFLLVTQNSSIAKDKLHLQNILSTFHYTQGKRYEDFSEGTDHVAGYGLAALITGVAAKKLGLLALAGAFIIKLWKLLILIPIIFLGKIKNFIIGKSRSNEIK